MRWITAIVVISLGLSASALAQKADKNKMYKWTDENGTVHYSAKPEEQAQVEELTLRRGPAKPAGEPGAVVDPAEVARCEQVRNSVRNLQSSAKDLQIRAPDGSTRPMTAEERAPLLERYREEQAQCDKMTPAAPK